MDEQPNQSLPNQPQTTPSVGPVTPSTLPLTPVPNSPDPTAPSVITPIRVPQPPQTSPDTVQLGEFKRQKFIKKAHQIIMYFLTVLEILFTLRFLFKLITANSTSPLVIWIYDISGAFVYPFVGIVKNSGRGAHISEWTTLLAMGLYALFALILIGLVKLFAPTAPQKVWEE
ncbi:hypothetical protein KJ596_00735 [Patescibacteria group bacterium]|nr:hypothetical protein [Patescibacteria group bacterium]MBU1868483.1 hypothetical protein [Patescibacteria group bacterium]